MAHMRKGRHTADLQAAGDEVVVFLIGMRINKPWKFREWFPVMVAMPKMLRYLQQDPDKGLLGYRQSVFPDVILVQYWRSFADLERFARNPDDPHLEPWRQFNRAVKASGDVGICTRPTASRRPTPRPFTATCTRSGWARHLA